MHLSVRYCIMNRLSDKLDARMCHDRNGNDLFIQDRLTDPVFHIQFTHNFCFLTSSYSKTILLFFCNLEVCIKNR